MSIKQALYLYRRSLDLEAATHWQICPFDSGLTLRLGKSLNKGLTAFAAQS